MLSDCVLYVLVIIYPWPLPAIRHCLGDLVVYFIIDTSDVLVGQQPQPLELLSISGYRIVFPGLLELTFGSIVFNNHFARCSFEVGAQPIGLSHDQTRTAATSRPVDKLLYHVISRDHIVTIHAATRDTASLGSVRQIFEAVNVGVTRSSTILVVLEHIDDRQLPGSSDDHRFMDGTLACGSVSEHANANLI